ncbi:MAG: XdhC family protein [Actinomycetota bacterium]
MGHDIIRELAAAIERGEPVVLATVVRTDRSVPRRPGTKMLVHADGRIDGTVGGGEMEARVRREAAEALADGRPRLLSFDLVDPTSGDPGVCGGTVDLYLEPHMPDPLLFVVGAGHVGRAVADLARWLGFRTVVWDDRPEAIAELAAAPATGPAAGRHTGAGNLDAGNPGAGNPDAVPAAPPPVTATGPIDAALAASGVDAQTSIVMVTRNVDLDLELLPPLLSSPAGYLGLMGSTRRWATTRARLLDAGLAGDHTDVDLDRIVSPIGIEIGAETPEEIAVSILAQVVARRRT